MNSFGRAFLFWALLMGFTALLTSCSEKPETARVSGSVWVRIPWPADGEVRLRDVELRGLESLYELSGSYARFYYGPKLVDGGLEGNAPKARFVRGGDGVYRPTDVLSQDLAVLYAHLQGLHDLTAELGVASSLRWPRDVGVSTRLIEGERLIADNSFYDGTRDAILVVPYKSKSLPLAQNAGVTAHEFFHALYHRHVIAALLQRKVISESFSSPAHGDLSMSEAFEGGKPRPREDRPGQALLYNSLLQKAFNEGLADFWAWIYTGDPDFLAFSLPRHGRERTLRSNSKETSDFTLFSSKELLSSVDRFRRGEISEAALTRESYAFGTKISRLAKHLAEIGGPSDAISRKKWGARLMKALPAWREKAQSGMRLEARHFFEIFGEAEPMSAPECEEWLKILGKKFSCLGDGDAVQLKAGEAKPAPPESVFIIEMENAG